MPGPTTRSNRTFPSSHSPHAMRHPLPYAFARSSQLLLEDDGHTCVLWHGPAPDAGALSEVMRKHAVRGADAAGRARHRAAHQRGLFPRGIQRGDGGERGRIRRRPLAHDAGAAGRGGPAGIGGRRAHHPHAQRPAHAGRARRRERHPHRALRAAFERALPRGRHAARSGAAEPRAACGADLPPEDHGGPGHLRKAPAPGRPHQPAAGHARDRRARLDPAERPWRAGGAAPAGQEREQAEPGGRGHAGATRCAASTG